MVSLSKRERRVLDLLAEGRDNTVRTISAVLDVSEVTIRSDLAGLADKGFIVRTRGGGLPAFHPSIIARLQDKERGQQKERIAKAAADLISDGDNVMIVAGTTASLIVKFLFGTQDVHIVTNSTLVLPYARVNPSLHLTFVGGEFCPSGEAMAGPIALRELEQFHAKTAFLGTDGFSLEHGVTAHLVELAEVVKKMAERADEVVLVADSSKYGSVGFAYILPLTDIDRIITDDKLSRKDRTALEKKGISLQIV